MIPSLPDGFSHPMQIGEGAFGSVYRVRQQYLDRWVALKIIRENNNVKRDEFLREARVQAKIKADCVPQIYDAFEWKRSVCIVMQWVKGVSLSTILERETTIDERVTIAGGLIHALAQLHSLGFAHRDIKPANVLIEPNTGIYLVDFGFSKDITDSFKSSVSNARGTPAYMAPEIWQCGGAIDLMRADVYAAGVVLRELLEASDLLSFTEPLVERKPDARPESGRTVKKLWLESKGASYPVISWKHIAEKNHRHELSDKLYHAAQQLIIIRRYNEAYELIVESLEENPDNTNAIDLMSKFAAIAAQKPARIIAYIALTAILFVAIVVSFFVGKRSVHDNALQVINSEENRVLLKNSDGPDKISAALPLKSLVTETHHYYGSLIIDRSGTHGISGSVYVDSILYSDTAMTDKKIDLNYGEHTITMIDARGVIVYREKVRLLPFQIKRIKLTPAGKIQ